MQFMDEFSTWIEYFHHSFLERDSRTRFPWNESTIS